MSGKNGFDAVVNEGGPVIKDSSLNSVFKAEAGDVGGNSYMGENNPEIQTSRLDRQEGAKYLKPKKG